MTYPEDSLSKLYQPKDQSTFPPLFIPDALLRISIRNSIQSRLASMCQGTLSENKSEKMNFIHYHTNTSTKSSEEKKEAEFVFPLKFFQYCFEDNLMYTCGYFENGAKTLREAGVRMMDLCIERAQIVNGMRIIDYGSAWGCMTLYLAQVLLFFII